MTDLTTGLSRRTVLGASAAGLLAGATSPIGSCGGEPTVDEDARPVRLGYLSPQTGPLAPFGEADEFVVEAVKNHVVRFGLSTRAGMSNVEIIVRDTGSDPEAARAAAEDLIDPSGGAVDLVLAASTPSTTNPVADVCEAAGMPCISSIAPWQSWFFGRGASPVTVYDWTFHFYWGQEAVQAVFLDMWDALPSNGRVGAVWPDDPDGRAWGDPATGFLPAVAQRGYEIIDPSFYPPGSPDFTPQIELFKDAGVDLVVGVPTPPDFSAFWSQAREAGFDPLAVTVGKALLFPSVVEGLGPLAEGLGIGAGWTPTWPYTSSLTGQSSAELAAAYTSATGRRWTQPLAFIHALFEVAAAALAAADHPGDREGIAAALAELRVDTVVGRLDWLTGPVPNVATTPLVGGQWQVGAAGPELVVVSNAQALEIPAARRVRPLPAPAGS